MAPEYSSVAGSAGGIAKSGKSIYDALHDSPDFFLVSGDLEVILRTGLLGLDLNYPLRTRSKVLKSKICEILGYPVPTSFKKSKPRFPGRTSTPTFRSPTTFRSGMRKSLRRGDTSSSGWMRSPKS